MTFQEEIRAGIPNVLPEAKLYDPAINHAPKRKDILTPAEKELALKNIIKLYISLLSSKDRIVFLLKDKYNEFVEGIVTNFPSFDNLFS